MATTRLDPLLMEGIFRARDAAVTTTTTTPPPCRGGPPANPEPPGCVVTAPPTPPATEPTTGAPIPPPVAYPAPVAASGGVWACVRQAEAGGNYGEDSGNGYFGAYQFLPSTWDSVARRLGMTAYVGVLPSNAPPAVQDQFAAALQAEDGWGQWGARTRTICGLW